MNDAGKAAFVSSADRTGTGLEFLQKMVSGEYANLPIGDHLGFRIAGLALFGVDLAGESAATCDAATAVLKALFGVGTRPVTIPAWLPTPLNRSLKRHLATIDRALETS